MKTKIISIILTLVVINGAMCQNSFKEYLELMKNTVIESYKVDLNQDHILDEMVLKFPSRSEHPDFGYDDPGVFNLLELNLSNSKPFVLDNAFDSLAKPIRKDRNNRLESDLIYLTNEIKGAQYLLISGPGYGCCLPKQFIIKISQQKIEVIHEDEFEVTDFSYNENDGNYYFSGYTNLGESWGGYTTQFEFQTFVYPKVYKLTDRFVYDQQRTYDLNKQKIDNYGNFLGYSRPVLVTNKETNEVDLVDFQNGIEDLYRRKYDEASRRKLDLKYLNRFSNPELRLMRNEIFASYGYIFSSPDLKEYFEQKKWYRPISKDVNDRLTEIEKYNIELIRSEENAP